MNKILAFAVAAVLCSCAPARIVRSAQSGDLGAVRGELARKPDRCALQQALCRAAAAGKNDVLEALLAAGAQVDEPLPEQYLSLHFFHDWHSCPCDDVETAEDHFKVPPAYGQSALMCAAKFGRKETVEYLLAKGADVNAHGTSRRSYCELSDDRAEGKALGYTALTWAAAQGHMDIVKLLLAHGADPAIPVPDIRETCWEARRVPADFARENGHEDIAALLEKSGGVLQNDADDGEEHHKVKGVSAKTAAETNAAIRGVLNDAADAMTSGSTPMGRAAGVPAPSKGASDGADAVRTATSLP